MSSTPQYIHIYFLFNFDNSQLTQMIQAINMQQSFDNESDVKEKSRCQSTSFKSSRRRRNGDSP